MKWKGDLYQITTSWSELLEFLAKPKIDSSSSGYHQKLSELENKLRFFLMISIREYRGLPLDPNRPGTATWPSPDSSDEEDPRGWDIIEAPASTCAGSSKNGLPLLSRSSQQSRNTTGGRKSLHSESQDADDMVREESESEGTAPNKGVNTKNGKARDRRSPKKKNLSSHTQSEPRSENEELPERGRGSSQPSRRSASEAREKSRGKKPSRSRSEMRPLKDSSEKNPSTHLSEKRPSDSQKNKKTSGEKLSKDHSGKLRSKDK